MDSLVQHLSAGSHPVEIVIRPERTIQALKACLDRGYIHLRFPQTRGGTELGVRILKGESKVNTANFENRKGIVEIVGTLTLNYTKVKCVSAIDIETFTGTGHLVLAD